MSNLRVSSQGKLFSSAVPTVLIIHLQPVYTRSFSVSSRHMETAISVLLQSVTFAENSCKYFYFGVLKKLDL